MKTMNGIGTFQNSLFILGLILDRKVMFPLYHALYSALYVLKHRLSN